MRKNLNLQQNCFSMEMKKITKFGIKNNGSFVMKSKGNIEGS